MSDDRYLTFALGKGRLAKKTLQLFEQIGITCEEMKDPDTRKLIFVNEELKLRFFLAKGPDVPTYVEYGAADIGVVGKDTILEEGSGFQERLLELLGEQHQEDHGGVFTDFGYAELGGEIKDIYVCQSNETACFHRSDAPVMLEVRKGFFNDPSYDNDKTAVLNLPAADAGIWRAVEKVDAASVDECAFRCVDCLIPFLRDAINNAIDDEDGIEQADEFAKRLAQIEREWPESDMVKYKALLSVVDHPSLQDATRLMGEIDQYELRPEVAQTWGYAEMMFREKYSALPEELFQTPQAAQIGQKMLDDRLGVITEYGLIRRKDGQPLPVFQPEQEIGQGLEMM